MRRCASPLASGDYHPSPARIAARMCIVSAVFHCLEKPRSESSEAEPEGATNLMNRSITRKFIAVLTVALLCGAVAAEAAIRIEVPEQGPGIPAYARINGPPLSIRPW